MMSGHHWRRPADVRRSRALYLSSLLLQAAQGAENAAAQGAENAAAPATLHCNNTGTLSSRNAHCRFQVDLSPAAASSTISGLTGGISGHRSALNPPQLICVQNAPLSLGMLLAGGLLRLFDVETVRIRGDKLGQTVEIHSASEDTGFASAYSALSAESAARSAFSPSEKTPQLHALRGALRAVWSGTSNMHTLGFSPFYPSCVGLRATTVGGANVSVEWFREGPLSGLGGERGGRDGLSLRLWSGPLLFLAGLLLNTHALTLADSIVFHYASGVGLAMLLGVLLVVFFVWSRTGRRRPGVVLTAMLSLVGVTASALRDWAKGALLELAVAHWPYVLAYLGLFGLIGYVFTYMRLQGGSPPPHECVLLARGMRLLGVLLIGCSTNSIRAALSLVLAILLASSTTFLSQVYIVYRVYAKLTERGPAGPPSEWTNDDGKVGGRWRPPTSTGRYLSEAEYADQGKRCTDSGLQALFASPQYQQWLLKNHQRMGMADAVPLRQPDFEEEED